MPKTRIEIYDAALSRIGVLAVGEVPSAAEYADVRDAFDAVCDELRVSQGLTLPTDLDATPDGLAQALAWLVAEDLAVAYEIPPKMARSRAVMRVRTYLLPDDREDVSDLDGDGVISEAEAEAAKRARYF